LIDSIFQGRTFTEGTLGQQLGVSIRLDPTKAANGGFGLASSKSGHSASDPFADITLIG